MPRMLGTFFGSLAIAVVSLAGLQAPSSGATADTNPPRSSLTQVSAEKVAVQLPARRKATFGSGAYQLDRGRIGYAKALLTPAYKRLLVKKRVKVDAIVTVLDEFGRQQTLRKRFRLKTVK